MRVTLTRAGRSMRQTEESKQFLFEKKPENSCLYGVSAARMGRGSSLGNAAAETAARARGRGIGSFRQNVSHRAACTNAYLRFWHSRMSLSTQGFKEGGEEVLLFEKRGANFCLLMYAPRERERQTCKSFLVLFYNKRPASYPAQPTTNRKTTISCSAPVSVLSS